MTDQDISTTLQSQVMQAIETEGALFIHAGNSKDFLGNTVLGVPLDVSPHRGILKYAPTELVITARAGTPLQEIEAALDEHNQILAFEPPHFGDTATLGGTIACNLSGPRRVSEGAARDFVLGTHIINGRGEMLHFGGEVMKNVAGYDVSRLMVGAMGTLGVLLDVSLKVLPRPQLERTLKRVCVHDEALKYLHQWAVQPLPISASCYDADSLYVRISGTEAAVDAASKKIGGETIEDAQFWQGVKEHTHGFFRTHKPLWRISLASDTPLPALEGKWLYEWGGALRWFISNEPAEKIQAFAQSAGGHATAYRNHPSEHDAFQALPDALATLHQRIKQAMDPAGIFNPGRMFNKL